MVEAIIENDAIKNVCTGLAKLKVRIGEGEDINQVKANFLRAGLGLHDPITNQNIKPVFTYKQSLMDRSPQRTEIDARLSKVQNLQTTMPETFGNNGAHQSRTYDHLEQSINKKATLIEKLAEQAWNRVSAGKKPAASHKKK